MTTLEKLMFLRSVDLFQSFRVEDLRLIAQISREEELDAGRTLFEAGQEADQLLVLVEGSASLYTDAGGRYHLLSMVFPGDVLGEIALFDGGAHPTAAKVEEPGSALVLDREDMLDLIREYPSLALAFLVRLAASVRSMQGRIQLLEDEIQDLRSAEQGG